MSKQIITISREFGSGGRSVGKRVAELLDVPYYDKKLVEQVAVETGFDEKFIEQEGEYASPWQSLLSYAFPGARLRHPVNGGLSTADFLWVIQCRVILDLAEKGPCVIVGRCADYALADKTNVVNLFIYADEATKTKRIMEKYNLPENKARDMIIKKDKQRQSYYNYYSSKKWGRADSYDLCINSSVLGVNGTVKLIIQYIEDFEKRND